MSKDMCRNLIIGLSAFAVIFVVNIAVDPSFGAMSRDGAAFAYCGQRISEGALLYRDCWDNKPPGIYYVDAAIITIAGATPWSIWLFQAIWLSLTTVAFYSIISKIWNHGTAIISTPIMLLTILYPVYFSNGNLTETYALLPITLTLGAFLGYLQTQKFVHLVGIGFLTAIAFLLKPTYASIGIAASLVTAYLLMRQHDIRKLFNQLGLLAASFIVPLILVAAYWASKNDLGDLLYAVFVHNRLYIQTGFSIRSSIASLRILILEQPLSSQVALALISLIVYGIENWKLVLQARNPKMTELGIDGARPWVMAALVVALMLDMIFVVLPGTNFRHYYLIPLLTMAEVSSYLFYTLQQIIHRQEQSRLYIALLLSTVIVLMLPWVVEILGKELPTRRNWQTLLSNPNITQYQPDKIEQFILENSSPEQSILIWDFDPAIYFHVDRRSPTRFIFLRHIYTPIPDAPNGFDELMHDLEADPPALILTSATSQQGLPYLGLNVDELCRDCPADIRKGVIEFKTYVDQNYQPYIDIQPWAIYKRIPLSGR